MPQAIDRSLATPMMRPRLPVISPRFSVIFGTLNREESAALSPHPTPLTVPVNQTGLYLDAKEPRSIKGLALGELLPHVLLRAVRFGPSLNRLLELRVQLARQHDD